jgi:hypothetical protein
MLRLSRLLDSQLTDGGEVVSLTKIFEAIKELG